jgi:hypothetical protein
MTGDQWAARPLPQPHQAPGVSKAKATAILSERQFRAARPGLVAQILRWLGQHLALAATRLLGGGYGALLGWMLLGLAVAVVGLLVYIGTRTLRGDPARLDAPLRVEVHRSPTDWRRLADEHEARSDWKEGLRCRYRALIAELIALHVVLDLPGRTTGEYRGDVGATLPEAAPDFAGASELFERAWYGDRPTGADQSRQFVQLAEAVVDQARRRHRTNDRVDDAVDERQLVSP